MSQPPLPPINGPPRGGVSAPVLLYALVLLPVTAFAGWVITYGHDDEAMERTLRDKYGAEIRSVEQKRHEMSDLYMAAIKQPGSNPEQEERLQQVLRGGRGAVKRHFAVDPEYYGTEKGAQARDEYLQQEKPLREEEARRLRRKLKKLKKKQQQQQQAAAAAAGDGENTSGSGSDEETTASSEEEQKATRTSAAAELAAAEVKAQEKGLQTFTRKRIKRKLEKKQQQQQQQQSSSVVSSQVVTMAVVATVAAAAGYLLGGGRSSRS